MQDRFAIGPVTIVQLVGLTTKPRIVSAHVDTAVRPATTARSAGSGSGIGGGTSVGRLLDAVRPHMAQASLLKAPLIVPQAMVAVHRSHCRNSPRCPTISIWPR